MAGKFESEKTLIPVYVTQLFFADYVSNCNEPGTFLRDKLLPITFGTKYSRMDQVKFVEESLSKVWKDMICSRQVQFF